MCGIVIIFAVAVFAVIIIVIVIIAFLGSPGQRAVKQV